MERQIITWNCIFWVGHTDVVSACCLGNEILSMIWLGGDIFSNVVLK